MNKKLAAVLLSGAMVASMSMVAGAEDKIEITFWHAMGGVNGEATQQMIDDFNASQDEIVVTG